MEKENDQMNNEEEKQNPQQEIRITNTTQPLNSISVAFIPLNYSADYSTD